MKIVLVYPSLAGSDFHVGDTPVLFSHIHAGLCSLSAVCKKEGFTDISVIDLRMLHGWDEFKKKVQDLKPDVAGVTLMSPDYDYAMKCIDIIKDVDRNIRTVAGGMHPTIRPGEMERNPNVDYIIMGEGEVVFPELLKKLKNGKTSERLIKGVRADVDKLPFIDRELFDFLEMPRDFFFPLPFVTIMAGRGCSYNCKFCSPAGKIMNGPHIRRRSVDNVIEELKQLKTLYGFKSLMIWDDCFAENKEWVMEFCAAYRKNGFDQPFTCQLRADIICRNPGMIKALKKAGLVMASIGFESGNDRILKFVNKGSTLKENFQAARICKRYGIKIWAYHIFGLPTETNEEALDTVKMIKKIKPYRSDAAFFTPRLGSVFYDYCKKNNLTLIDDHEQYINIPEIDKPKIRNIDYDFIRRLAIISKSPPLRVKIIRRIERMIFHKKNKLFRQKFQDEVRKSPEMNKMAILRLAHEAGRI